LISNSDDVQIHISRRSREDDSPVRGPTAADAIEDEVHDVLAICEGDAVAPLRITLIANAFLKAEIDRLSAAALSGFARGKVRKATLAKEAKRRNTL